MSSIGLKAVATEAAASQAAEPTDDTSAFPPDLLGLFNHKFGFKPQCFPSLDTQPLRPASTRQIVLPAEDLHQV